MMIPSTGRDWNTVSGPELLHGACNDRASPDDRIVRILQKQVNGHHGDAALGRRRIQRVFVAARMTGHAEDLRNGRSGDIRVENAHGFAFSGGSHRQKRGDKRFSDASLA